MNINHKSLNDQNFYFLPTDQKHSKSYTNFITALSWFHKILLISPL